MTSKGVTRSSGAKKRGAQNAASFAAPTVTTMMTDAIRYFRLEATSLLGESSRTGDELAHDHFGLQAQDPDAALLTIFNRLRAPTQSRALLATRYLAERDATVRAWGQRCTLHMYAVADWPVAAAASRERLHAATEASYKCGPAGIAEAAKKVSSLIERELNAGREVDSRVVSDVGDEEGLSDDTMAMAKLRRYPLLHATERGLGSRVSRDGKLARLVVLAPRRCEWPAIKAHAAAVQAARRYFQCYAPATEADFRYWMGLRAGESGAAVNELIEEEFVVQVDGLPDGLLIAKTAAGRLQTLLRDTPPRQQWPVRLLGRFDPYLLPHKSKDWVVAEKERPRVWTRNADILPAVLVHGRIRGIWKLTRKKSSASVVVTLFAAASDDERLTQVERDGVVEEANRIAKCFWEVGECDVSFVDEGSEQDDGKRKVKRRKV